jgi:pyruvate dehydrogenase E2 component (dihydrolipoamide acetyltransferase)
VSSEISTQEPEASAPVAAPSRDSVVPADVVDQPHARAASTPRKSNGRSTAASKPTEEESRKQRSSPLVRRIARDNDVDISQIHGSGLGGRVTKNDILGYIDQGSGIGDQGSGVAAEAVRSPVPDPESRVEIKPLSVMRRKIAEHMVMSRRTSAHVHSVFHVNFSTVERIRQQRKAEFEQLGVKLTYMAFIAKAAVSALRRFPIVNASLDGDNVIYKKDINLGIAVALETGLIVPVIKHADEKNLLGLSRAIADIAGRARSKQLKHEEVHDGTFTITNPGQFGSQFGMPIINQPQVAILGIGTIEKRAVVVDDAIAIRTMAYLTLGYDHRLVDGATGDQFMAEIKQQIEQFDPNQA